MSEAWKLRVQFSSDDGMKMIRPFRQYFGDIRKKDQPIGVEVHFEEDESIYACLLDATELASHQWPRSLPGRAVSVSEIEGLVLTPDPQLFGTDANRAAANQYPFVKLNMGEWNLLNGRDFGL
jgi:hypothetical protein